MSLVTYILQSCKGNLKCRITFNNPTYLDVGETWNVDCSDIENGCYQVLENTEEALETFNGDECIFTEYNDCLDCENNLNIATDENNDTPLIGCIIWESCELPTEYLYVNSGYTAPDASVYFNGRCYIVTTGTTQVESTDDISSSTFYEKCSECLGLNPSNTPTPTVTPSVTPTPDSSVSLTPTQTPSNTITPTPSTEVSDCVSGTTTGNYRFTDCCGVSQIGSSIGVTFCVNTTLYYDGINLTSLPCSVNCDDGPLEVLYEVTPDCDDDGAITLNISGGTKPYTVVNVIPGSEGTIEGDGPFIYSGLSGGTYVFNIYDNTFPTARQESIQIDVPGCLEVTITGTSVSCFSNSATITLSGSSNSYPYTYYLYYNDILIQTEVDNVNTITFTDNLLAGEYYGVIVDGTEQTGITSTFTVISNQGSVDFGYSVTGSSPCISTNNGYAELTGITGTPPFTYQWSNGQTTQSANNLPSGNVSVTVTDSNGCFKTENIVIPQLPKLGISTYTSTQPQCFSCDGTITIAATGGTTPYYFSGSTGQIQSFESNTFTLTGLCAGLHSIEIQDSALCKLVQSYQLNGTAGFTVVSINTQNSDCNSNGSIEINVDGVIGIVTYSLTGSTGDVQTTTTSNHTHTFNNLSSDTYIVGIQSQSGCLYTTEKTISNGNKFTVTNSSTGTTCGLNNGSVLIEVISGSTNIIYPLSYTVSRVNDGFIVFNNVSSVNPTQLVSNLSNGTYEITVTDNESCSSVSYVTINEDSEPIKAILYGTPCILGNDGTATLQIISGQAPFTIEWSNNVPESQINNYNISGLSGGTYSVTISSDNGCVLIKTVTIQCNNENLDGYVINTICEQDFTTTSQGIRGFREMLGEAFLDLNIPDSNCELVSATFKGVLTISGGSYGIGKTVENEFYTGYTLNDYPTNEEWEEVVDGLLSEFTGITFTTDIVNNLFTIQGICDGDEDPTNGAFVELRVEINLDVECDDGRILPTPSITPSITATPSITPSVTITPGASPSVTVTPSSTPPPFNCELVIIGSSRQLTCNLEIDYSVRTLNCNLIISGSI